MILFFHAIKTQPQNTTVAPNITTHGLIPELWINFETSSFWGALPARYNMGTRIHERTEQTGAIKNKYEQIL